MCVCVREREREREGRGGGGGENDNECMLVWRTQVHQSGGMLDNTIVLILQMIILIMSRTLTHLVLRTQQVPNTSCSSAIPQLT